jgi:hypothetical protein
MTVNYDRKTYMVQATHDDHIFIVQASEVSKVSRLKLKIQSSEISVWDSSVSLRFEEISGKKIVSKKKIIFTDVGAKFGSDVMLRCTQFRQIGGTDEDVRKWVCFVRKWCCHLLEQNIVFSC